mmetsp:Transcript_625/g.1420  ORF Transcript_625/g.1420 Transcript_625/m.1420 type:complete len:135 (-) Transcript_625:1501-1905(-)
MNSDLGNGSYNPKHFAEASWSRNHKIVRRGMRCFVLFSQSYSKETDGPLRYTIDSTIVYKTQHVYRSTKLYFSSGSAGKIIEALVGVIPKGVEDTGLVRALVSVSSEEVTLRLDKVGGEVGTAVLVVVAQRSRG